MMIEGLGLGREGFRLEQGDAWHGVREGGGGFNYESGYLDLSQASTPNWSSRLARRI
jgi:hypothetical protein